MPLLSSAVASLVSQPSEVKDTHSLVDAPSTEKILLVTENMENCVSPIWVGEGNATDAKKLQFLISPLLSVSTTKLIEVSVARVYVSTPSLKSKLKRSGTMSVPGGRSDAKGFAKLKLPEILMDVSNGDDAFIYVGPVYVYVASANTRVVRDMTKNATSALFRKAVTSIGIFLSCRFCGSIDDDLKLTDAVGHLTAARYMQPKSGLGIKVEGEWSRYLEAGTGESN